MCTSYFANIQVSMLKFPLIKNYLEVNIRVPTHLFCDAEDSFLLKQKLFCVIAIKYRQRTNFYSRIYVPKTQNKLLSTIFRFFFNNSTNYTNLFRILYSRWKIHSPVLKFSSYEQKLIFRNKFGTQIKWE